MSETTWQIAVEHGVRILSNASLRGGEGVYLTIPQPNAPSVRIIMLRAIAQGIELYLRPGMDGRVVIAPAGAAMQAPRFARG